MLIKIEKFAETMMAFVPHVREIYKVAFRHVYSFVCASCLLYLKILLYYNNEDLSLSPSLLSFFFVLVVLYSSSTAVVSGPPSPASYTRRTCVDPIATSVLLQDLSLTTVYPVLLRPRRHPLHGSPSGWVGTGRHWRWHVWPRATARRSNYRNAAAAQI